jgi:hypothetical protein
MIYRLLGWSILIILIAQQMNKQNNKEQYRNKELKNHGVGTFPVFNTQSLKSEEDDEFDYSNIDKDEVMNKINSSKNDRAKKFKEYVELKQNGDEGEYTKSLEKNMDDIDKYINELQNIYYKIESSKSSSKTNRMPKYDKQYDEVSFNLPKGNLLEVSDNRNIFENRIQSFNTDIRMVNKNKVNNELENKIFRDEFENMINKTKKNYYNGLLDYETIYDDEDNNEDNDEDNNEDNDEDNDEDNEEKGLLRKKEYEYVTKKDISLFNKIENIVLDKINASSKFETGINNNFIVVQKKLNYILYNKKDIKELVYDGEIVIYRNMKNHGKHIGFKVLVSNNDINIIELTLKGIVTEDKIHILISSNEFENNLVYYEYKDKYIMTTNPREQEVKNMSYLKKIGIMRNRKNALRLDRGLR